MKENKIYESTIGFCELLEDTGQYKGNGHHLAQKITKMVSVGLLPKCQKEIYDLLSKEPVSTKELSEKLDKPTKTISAQLLQMNTELSYIHTDKDEKGNRTWRTL